MSKSRSPISVINTGIDPELVEYINKTIDNDGILPTDDGTINVKTLNKKIRDVKMKPITTQYWFAGMIWHVIQRTNQSNFKLDITSFEDDTINLMQYTEGQHYVWHADTLYPGNLSKKIARWDKLQDTDDNIYVRKLSFSLPLTDPSEYEGGKLQFYVQGENKKVYTVDQQLGHMIVFVSRVCHRVLPVKSGTRRALVGWVLGPRWR